MKNTRKFGIFCVLIVSGLTAKAIPSQAQVADRIRDRPRVERLTFSGLPRFGTAAIEPEEAAYASAPERIDVSHAENVYGP